MTQTWDLGSYDGLGTARDDPDFFGRGLALTDSKYQGSGTYDSGIAFNRYSQKRKIEWPHKGYIQSYAMKMRNDSVNTIFNHSVVPAGGLSDAIANTKDAGVLWWYSYTPGGEPVLTQGGLKLVNFMFRVEQVFKAIHQRYSLQDPVNSKGDVLVSDSSNQDYAILFPIINKTYYINFAGVDTTVAEQCASKWGNTTNPNPRAPMANELIKFDSNEIGDRPSLSFISQVGTIWVPFDTYIGNVT